MAINLERLKTGGALHGPLVTNALQPVAPMRELVAGERVGAFEIEREISRGGMGIVYLAQRADGEFTQRVALKWICAARDHALAEALFRRERDILADLEHQGIARLIDGGHTHDGMLWFAMEYVEGDAIDRWCNRRALPMRARVRLVRELVEVLAFAHQRLLIHRDIKPANVLVTEQGQVKLLDFGIARLADQEDLFGSAVLTPGFASPEQWAQDEVTVASDVYQIGLLLAQVSGAMPPPVPDTHITRALQEAPAAGAPVELPAASLQTLPFELAAIIRRATALEPVARYATASAMGDDLQRWLDRRAVTAVGGGLHYQLRCAVRRHPWVASGTGLAVLILAALGWQLMLERDHAEALAVRATTEAERASSESARARASLAFLTELLQWANPRSHGGEEVTVTGALNRGAALLGTSNVESPRLRAELMQLVGSIYLSREEVEPATPLLREARTIILATSDVDAVLRARNALDLASALTSEEDQEALALLAEVRSLPDVDQGVSALRIVAARQRATLNYRRGDLPAAIAEQRSALDEIRAQQPTDSTETILIRTNLAGYVGDLGDHETSLTLKVENRDAALAAFGEAHPNTSLATTTLARTLLALGRLDEAEPLIESDGRVRARLWGENHPQYGVYLQNRARLERRRHKLDDARAWVLRAIAISQAGGDGGRLQLSSQYGDLADIELARGDAAAAERAARSALDPTLRRSAVVKDFGARLLTLVQSQRTLGRFEDVRAALPVLAEELAPLPERHPRHALFTLEAALLAEHDRDQDTAAGLAKRALLLARAAYPSVERDQAAAAASAQSRKMRPGS